MVRRADEIVILTNNAKQGTMLKLYMVKYFFFFFYYYYLGPVS